MQSRWLLILAATSWAQSPTPAHPVPSRPAWAGEILQAQNAIRSREHLPAVVWSDKLAGVAQQWAETLLNQSRFAHSLHSAYGENLFEMEGATASPANVVDAWASEARNYDYASNRCKDVCGHYTQI